ncbi:MAG TPA: hypothetical protein VFQ00_03300 [Terriglobales bacterium]|nr:hypothetical protein [Terriglobales bacterium]
MTPDAIYNRTTRAICGASYAVALLGNVTTADYELWDLAKVPLPDQTVQGFAKRGIRYLGVLAYHENAGPRVALETDELDTQTIGALSVRFLKQLEAELNRRVIERETKRISDAADAVEWLKRLSTLPDTRNGMEN